jgi:hypothetical protein
MLLPFWRERMPLSVAENKEVSRRIASEDMRAKKVPARLGKTQRDKQTGAWKRRFENRSADPKRTGRK